MRTLKTFCSGGLASVLLEVSSSHSRVVACEFFACLVVAKVIHILKALANTEMVANGESRKPMKQRFLSRRARRVRYNSGMGWRYRVL